MGLKLFAILFVMIEANLGNLGVKQMQIRRSVLSPIKFTFQTIETLSESAFVVFQFI